MKKNPIHVWRCSECGSLFAFEEGKEPNGAELPCCVPGHLEHVPELCAPGAEDKR